MIYSKSAEKNALVTRSTRTSVHTLPIRSLLINTGFSDYIVFSLSNDIRFLFALQFFDIKKILFTPNTLYHFIRLNILFFRLLFLYDIQTGTILYKLRTISTPNLFTNQSYTVPTPSETTPFFLPHAHRATHHFRFINKI